MRLQDKIAIVTGAAHGIGKAIAEVFAQEGASVLVADLDDAAREKAAVEINVRGDHARRHDVPRQLSVAEKVSLGCLAMTPRNNKSEDDSKHHIRSENTQVDRIERYRMIHRVASRPQAGERTR